MLIHPDTRSASAMSGSALAFSVPTRNHGSALTRMSVWSQMSGNAALATIHPMVPHTRIRGNWRVESGRFAIAIEFERLSVGMYTML